MRRAARFNMIALPGAVGEGGADAGTMNKKNAVTGETELLAVEQLGSHSATATATIEPAFTGADNESCFIRARVRLDMDPEPDLMAYTNPIRFILR